MQINTQSCYYCYYALKQIQNHVKGFQIIGTILLKKKPSWTSYQHIAGLDVPQRVAY